MSKVILITGASRGFGRLWTEAFLKRGDRVIATARNKASLNDFEREYGTSVLTLELDVTDRDQAFAVVEKAAKHFGHLDVVINNAGYGLFGAIEEASEEEARLQFETNLFGTLWITQAVLPFFRAQKSGHIVQVSSVLGLATVPLLGLYNATKFAVEGLSETLASEVKDFGIHITLVEPNAYDTDWASSSVVQSKPLEVYSSVKMQVKEAFVPDSVGKPSATVLAILELIDTANPPLRLLLGKIGLPFVKATYAHRLATFESWKEVSEAAHG